MSEEKDFERTSLIIGLIEKACALTGRKNLKEDEKVELSREWKRILVRIPTEYLEDALDLALQYHQAGQVFIVSEITTAWLEYGKQISERKMLEKAKNQPVCDRCNNTGWIIEIRKAATRCPNKCLPKTNDDKSNTTRIPPDFAASLKQFFSKISMPKVSRTEDYEYEQ
jgi:hypothetical protein